MLGSDSPLFARRGTSSIFIVQPRALPGVSGSRAKGNWSEASGELQGHAIATESNSRAPIDIDTYLLDGSEAALGVDLALSCSAY